MITGEITVDLICNKTKPQLLQPQNKISHLVFGQVFLKNSIDSSYKYRATVQILKLFHLLHIIV